MNKISHKELLLANTEAILNLFFRKSIFAYITIFLLSYFFLNLTIDEQNLLIEKYFYPVIITYTYFIISYIINYSFGNNSLEKTAKVKILENEKFNVKETALTHDRKNMSIEKITRFALHEASHFIAFLKEDFEKFTELNVYINRVYTKSDNKYQGNSLESIYNNAFIRYISFVAEKKYFVSSWEGFTDSNDFKEFELFVRTYLINSKESNFFINPINEIEAAYNAKLINNLKEQIERECEIYINKYEEFLVEVKNILTERDIETVEAKELLLKWKNSAITIDNSKE